jgi:hypothetical protein
MRRVLLAFAYSTIFNGILFTIGLAMASHPSSSAVRLATLLTYVPTQFAAKLLPPGNDLVYFASGFVISMSLSILLYAVLAWVIMTALGWRHLGEGRVPSIR